MKRKEDSSEKFGSLSDQELWQKIANSELAAMSFVYKSYYKELYYFGLKCCKDEQLTEDCIQDLFIRIWNKRHSIQVKYTIKAYLLTSLRRLAIDKLVAHKRQLAKEGEFPEGHEVSLSVQDLMIQSEMDEDQKYQLQKSMSLLTKKQHEVIHLRFYQEMSYDEIAEALGIKYQSVRNCVHEAMKILKGSLAPMVTLILLQGSL